MSTQINVTVGKAGLSDQAKRQTAANRQAKLDAAARIKAAAEGQRQRYAARLIRGIDADGKLLFGQPPQAPARREEPAAFRRQDSVYELLLEPQPELSAGIFGSQLKKPTTDPVNFIDWITFEPSPDNASYFYSATDGPTGGSYIECRQAYDLTSVGTGLRSISQDFVFDEADPAAKRKDFTVDLWAYLDVSGDLLFDNTIYAFELSPASDPYPDGTLRTLRIEMQYIRSRFGIGPYIQIFLERARILGGNRSLVDIGSYRDYDPSGVASGSYPSLINGNPATGVVPTVLKNTWNRISVVRFNNTCSLYVNGILISSTPEYSSSGDYLEPILDSGCLHIGQIYANGPSFPEVKNRLAKLRVTHKALFKSNFDPYTTP